MRAAAASVPPRRHRPELAVAGVVLALAALLWIHGLTQVLSLARWIAQTPEVCAGLPSFQALGAGAGEDATVLMASDLQPNEHVRAFFCAQYELAPRPLLRAEPGWPALGSRAATLAAGDRVALVLPAPGAAEEAQRVLAPQLAARGMRAELRTRSDGLAVLAIVRSP